MRRPMFVDVIKRFRPREATEVHIFTTGQKHRSHFTLKASTIWDCGALVATTPLKPLIDIFQNQPIVLTVNAVTVSVPNLIALASEAVHLKNCLSYEAPNYFSTGEVWHYGMLTKEASYSLWKIPVALEVGFSADVLGSPTVTLNRQELRRVPSPWLLLGLLVTDPIVRQVTTKIAGEIDEILRKGLIN